MRQAILLTCTAFGIVGCLPAYQIPLTKPSAEFVLVAENESRSTTIRSIYTWVFKNEDCEKSTYGMNAGSATLSESVSAVAPRRIAAGEKFVFTSAYIDARVGQNRQCSITGSFTPQPNHTYKALLLVNEQVTMCKLGIYDTTNHKDEQIEFFMPAFVCEDQGKSARPNGQPLWTDWRVRVIRTP